MVRNSIPLDRPPGDVLGLFRVWWGKRNACVTQLDPPIYSNAMNGFFPAIYHCKSCFRAISSPVNLFTAFIDVLRLHL